MENYVSKFDFDTEIKKMTEYLRESHKRFNARVRKLEGNWGAFVESLVRPGIIGLFKKQGINLRATYSNITEYKNDNLYYEIDLLSVNDKYAVIVETKTTLNVEDVDNHLARMQKIIEIPPRDFKLKGKTLLGAVAAVTIHSEADKYAQKKGLYVLKQEGNLLDMINPFHPKEWKL